MQRQALHAKKARALMDRQPDRAQPHKHRAVLDAVKDAYDAAFRGCFAILDRICARRSLPFMDGTEKRLSVEQRN